MTQIFDLVWSYVISGWMAVSKALNGPEKVSSNKLVAAAIDVAAVPLRVRPTGWQVAR